MKQKLAIARAIVHRPALVFLDEPTAGLDPAAAVALREDITSLSAENGTTVFLTTHNLTEAERVCGLVAVIRAGKLAALGAPGQLRARAGNVPGVATTPPPRAEPVWASAASGGGNPAAVHSASGP